MSRSGVTELLRVRSRDDPHIVQRRAHGRETDFGVAAIRERVAPLSVKTRGGLALREDGLDHSRGYGPCKSTPSVGRRRIDP